MEEVKSESDTLLTRISNTVENLFQKDTSYQYYLDENKIIPFVFRYYDADILIAATAITRSLILVSNDADLLRVQDILVEN